MLILTKKHTDTFIEQTRTRHRETLEFYMNEQMENFSFSPPINLLWEGIFSQAVTSYESTNSIFNITNEINSFSITIAGLVSSRVGAETINSLQQFLKLRSVKDFEVHVE